MSSRENPQPYFTPQMTNLLKGVAVVFMMIHHFFTFPEWYIPGIAYPELSGFAAHFQEPFKICVVVFAFITGYVYYFQPRKTYGYSMRKITDLLVSYWVVLIPFTLLAIGLGCYSFDLPGFLLELFALKRPIMFFCWYVCFYCVAMLLLPLLVKFIPEDKPAAALFIGILVPSIALPVLGQIPGLRTDPIWLAVVNNARAWFPSVVMGYLFAQFNWFGMVFDQIFQRNLNKRCQKVVVWMLLILAAFLGREFCPSFTLGSLEVLGREAALTLPMDLFYGPCFLYGTLKLFTVRKLEGLGRVFVVLGKLSLPMWFVSCLFFNACSPVTQPLLYAPRQPVLVLLWGLLLCFVMAIPADRAAKAINRHKNRLFDPSRFTKKEDKLR